MTLDDVRHNFLFLGDAHLEQPPNHQDIEAQGLQFLIDALSRFKIPLPNLLETVCFYIRYDFYPGNTLQFAVSVNDKMFLSDPQLWPMGDGWTIVQEIKARL